MSETGLRELRGAAGVRPGPARLAAALLILAIGLAVYLISARVLTYSVNNNDIVAHLFQAEVFAMGKLYVPSPPMREAFETSAVVNDGKMYSRYDPGHSAVLALGLLLFHSFKITLGVLAALNAFLTYRLGLALWGDRSVALLALVILLVSPFFILASSTELPHTSLFLTCALFLLALLHALDRDRWPAALLAGLGLGAGLLIRPFEALCFALPGASLLAWRALGVVPQRRPPFLRPLGSGRRLLVLAAWALGFAALGSLTFAYNRALTGDPFKFPRQRFNEIWGFTGEDRVALDLVDSPRKFLHMYYYKHLYVVWVLADHFLPLATGFQILLALFLLLSRDRGSRLLVAILLFYPLPFLAYYWYGDYWNAAHIGPRYLFPLLLPLALMSARLAAELYRRLGRAGRFGRLPVALALGYLAIEATVRADLPRWLAREYENTRGRAAFRAQVMPPPGVRALVFVPTWVLGADGVSRNHPSFDHEVVFARNRGVAANLELGRTVFPERSIYVGKIRVDPQSFLPAWDLLGPFYAPFAESLDRPFIDEAAAGAPPAAGPGAGWTLHRPPLAVVDFAAVYAGRALDNAVAYARATIRAAAETTVVLRYGSDDGIAIWLDGEQLVHEPVQRGADLDQGHVSAHLRSGSNLLLVKVNQASNPWQFVLRVTDERGGRPPGLSFSTPLVDGIP